MASPLGQKVIVALAEQGWMVVVQDEQLFATAPSGDMGAVFPIALFEDPERQAELRVNALLPLAIMGFQWPWPDPGKPIG